MSNTKELLSQRRAITPLWIVALFVSLTETVLGVAVTQTSGTIQTSLTVFVIFFPLIIAGSFFAILWSKPYVFYPPTEFGPQTNVGDYVEAMRGKITVMTGLADVQMLAPPTDRQIKAADQIVEMLLGRLAPVGLMFLYAFSLAHTHRKTIVWEELNTVMDAPEDTYGMGILSAVSAVGMLKYVRLTRSESTSQETGPYRVNIEEMNEELKKGLRPAIKDRPLTLEKEGYFDGTETKESYEQWQNLKIKKIEELLGS